VSQSQIQPFMARDGHTFSAYLVNPDGKARGAVVVLQEIFGLTSHIRSIADSYAADGYLTIAPSLFDRIRRDIVLGYSPPEVEQGMGYRLQVPIGKALLDIAACAAVVRHAGRVAVLGFCWGGTLAWSAAGSVPLAAAVCYYGPKMLEQSSKTPACPTLLHFGERDPGIPMSEVEALRAAYPSGEYHLYPAGHAFANADRPDRYDAQSASLARTRTHAFLAQRIG
jgi:carboxymethylenebutenolidase